MVCVTDEGICPYHNIAMSNFGGHFAQTSNLNLFRFLGVCQIQSFIALMVSITWLVLLVSSVAAMRQYEGGVLHEDLLEVPNDLNVNGGIWAEAFNQIQKITHLK